MKNKKIKILFGVISFCSVAIATTYIASSKQNTIKNIVKDNADITNDNVLPSSFFDIKGTTLYGYVCGTNSASFTNYDTIVIPASVEALRDNCFHTCYTGELYPPNVNDNDGNIKKIISEEGSQLITIGSQVIVSSYYGLRGLTTIDLTNSVHLRTLSECSFSDSFEGFSPLTKVKLPPLVEKIPALCFYKCSSLSDINLADLTNLNEIGISAFYNCTSISSIVFPDSLSKIDENAFRNNHFSELIFPKNLTYLGTSAFSGEVSTTYPIKKVDFSKCKNFKRIEDYCFSANLSSECSLIFDDALEYIGNSAFISKGWQSSFDGINKFPIPKNVSYIGYNNFVSDKFGKNEFVFTPSASNANVWCLLTTGSNSSLDYIVDADLNAMNSSIYGFATSAFGTAYGGNLQFSGTFKFPSNLHYINDSAFQMEQHITEYLNIPKCLRKIGNNAFDYNDSISSFVLPKKSELISIGASAFNNCSALTKFEFSSAKDLSYIGNNCFESCYSLVGVNLANNTRLRQLGDECFANMSNLKHVTLPFSLLNVGENTFKDDFNVEDVYFSYSNGQFLDPNFNVFGVENFPKLQYGGHVYIPNGMTKQDYLKALPDLPADYSFDSTVWENWDAPTEDKHFETNVNWDKILFIIFGSLAGVMLIVIVVLTIALAKKKVHHKKHHHKKSYSRY